MKENDQERADANQGHEAAGYGFGCDSGGQRQSLDSTMQSEAHRRAAPTQLMGVPVGGVADVTWRVVVRLVMRSVVLVKRKESFDEEHRQDAPQQPRQHGWQSVVEGAGGPLPFHLSIR